MNQKENHAEAERLAGAAHSQLQAILRQVENARLGTVTNDHVQTLLQVVEVTGQLAQVHATLATVPDPTDYAAQAKLGPL